MNPVPDRIDGQCVLEEYALARGRGSRSLIEGSCIEASRPGRDCAVGHMPLGLHIGTRPTDVGNNGALVPPRAHPPRAGRSGSCRPASRGGAAASSSPATVKSTLCKRAAAHATCSRAFARAGTPPTTSSGRGRPRPFGSSRTSICRRSEVLDLRWRNIGKDALNLEDSKTGPRAVPLGEAARALIETLSGTRKPEAFLFPSYAHGKGYYLLRNCWCTVCSDAKLGRLRLYDLRHTAASQAVMAGENLPLVGKLLGHRRHRVDLPVPDPPLVRASDGFGIAASIAGCGCRTGTTHAVCRWVWGRASSTIV